MTTSLPAPFTTALRDLGLLKRLAAVEARLANPAITPGMLTEILAELAEIRRLEAEMARWNYADNWANYPAEDDAEIDKGRPQQPPPPVRPGRDALIDQLTREVRDAQAAQDDLTSG